VGTFKKFAATCQCNPWEWWYFDSWTSEWVHSRNLLLHVSACIFITCWVNLMNFPWF